MLWLLPLLIALVVVAPVVLAPVSRRADLLVSRLALPVFGFYVSNESSNRSEQERLLRSAYVGTTHRVYAARTLLMATLAGISGSILGVYAVGGTLRLLAINHEMIEAALPDQLAFLAELATLQTASLWELFVLLLLSSATVGAGLAVGTYWLRWTILEQKADARARKIDATLPRMVAFIYALSRSGMPFPAVMETLTRNQDVYGESAREIGVAVREINVFGTDMLTALQRMASRSPSNNMEEFGENLSSVLGSGRNLSDFLREQYEFYQEEAESQQEQYMNLLSMFAEVYVTVFVAGPLFFITVLVIIGLVIQDTLALTRAIAYVAIPLASAGFILYIDSIIGSLRDQAVDGANAGIDRGRDTSLMVSPDGGFPTARQQRNYERLLAYDRLKPARRWATAPVESFKRQPLATLVVTVPIGLLWITIRVEELPTAPMALLMAIDIPLIEATLLILGAFALVYELKERRRRALEDAVPDLLDRMASVNEAGMTIVESIHRVTRSDLGALSPEIQRTWEDIRWGADAETALYRLDDRTDSVAITRAVTLLSNAMQASGNIAPVLRIAAEEAAESRRLRRERRQEMFVYQMVIYIAFLVFLGIIVALAVAFIPAVEAAGATGPEGDIDAISGGLFIDIGAVDTEAYELLFFHITAIQAVCSGLIAGQLGEGGVHDGAKHAVILLLLSYLLFVVVF